MTDIERPQLSKGERLIRQLRGKGCLVLLESLLVVLSIGSFRAGEPSLGWFILLVAVVSGCLAVIVKRPIHLRNFEWPTNERLIPQPTAPEGRAYRQAGHATMSYLIRRGFIDKFVPIGREDILPQFETVSIEGDGGSWAKTTTNVGSLLTAAQVLLAGHITELIHMGGDVTVAPMQAELLIRTAKNLVSAYVDEYGGDQLRIPERDRETERLFTDLYPYVVTNVQRYWPSIEALAMALLTTPTLSEDQAFAIVDELIPAVDRAQAKAYADRDLNVAVRETLARLKQTQLSGGESNPSSPSQH